MEYVHQSIIGDPDKLLESLRDHLTEAGGIREKSISELVSLMSNTNGKLVPKCISLCIISASELSVQSLLCDTDAWDILLKWLQESLKEENFSFLVELMQVYHDLPVTLEQLTRNVCPKLINSLSKKSDNEDVRLLATEIVRKWKGVINRNSRKDSTEVQTRKRKLESVKENASAGDSPSATKEVKRRRSTVKVPPTVMRTAGIEEANDQVVLKSRSEVLAKKSKIEIEKVEPVGPIESFHQKITVTPAEPKKSPHEVHESFSFINALANSQPVVRKKRKVCKTESLSNPPESGPESEDLKASSFESANSEAQEFKLSSDLESQKRSSVTGFTTFAVDKRPRKRVTWAPEESLQQISYFEVDDSERVNVTRFSLAEIRQKEHSLERQLFKRHEEIEIKDAKWYPPIALELTLSIEPGCKSVERQVQLDRERFVLQAIYFTRESIPFSPEEPEKEEFEAKMAVEIPLEDLHAKDLLVVNDKGDGNSQMSLNPEVANLVKSLVLNFNQDNSKASTPAVTTTVSPTAPFNQTSSLNTSPDQAAGYGSQDHSEGPMRPDMGPPRMSGPPFMSGERCPPPHNGMRPRGPPMRPPLGPGGPLPYRHPQYAPPDVPPPRFARGPMPPPPFRGPPPPMYGGGRPPMNGPGIGGGRRGGRVEQVCKFFQQGNCRNGSSCHFLHPGYQSPNW
ncbi:serine:threonine protein phosphatase 1 [Echinococcus multilocularis]|uniref:Serine:threonine protein phosphatase 1 n=1 Tax=Echinococcus multilocularis TaxID=6211 RepID=A0A087W237_ECHMU|nr:serine:threonine protein phosphatase 1 [Echinococcus multilocularis]